MNKNIDQDINYTIDELIATCIARQIEDREVVVQGISTPLVLAGYLLAKCTHAPELMLASAIGQGVSFDWGPLRVSKSEELWIDKAINNMGFVQVATEILPRFKPKEFFRPAQIDRCGNFNNLAIGKDHSRPRMRLPGSGGIPDVTTYSDDVFIYVPYHSRAVFVSELDFRSGLGHSPDRTHGSGPKYLISNLGQFDFEGGELRLVTLHAGVTLEDVQAKTEFDVKVAPELDETPAPTEDEVRLLREEIDPLGVRRLEFLRATARKVALQEILAREKEI